MRRRSPCRCTSPACRATPTAYLGPRLQRARCSSFFPSSSSPFSSETTSCAESPLAQSNSDFVGPGEHPKGWALADRVLLYGMGVGTLLMLQPFWDGGLKWGFFVTLASTVLEIVTGHMLPQAPGA